MTTFLHRLTACAIALALWPVAIIAIGTIAWAICAGVWIVFVAVFRL